MSKSMMHLNGNVLCAVDVETTGLDPDKHEILQIAVLPLDSNMEPMKSVTPFDMKLKPDKVENIDYEAVKVTKLRISDHILKGMDQFEAADIFYEWSKKLKLPINKRISPLAHNWPFDSSFIRKWLGPRMFDEIFDGRFRDLMAATLFLNDKADFHMERCPFPKNNLKYICTTLQIQHDNAHDALSDCLVTAQAYKAIVKRGLF